MQLNFRSHLLTENVARPVQSCKRLSKFAFQLSVRVQRISSGRDNVSEQVLASFAVGYNDERRLLLEYRFSARFGRSMEVAEFIDDGLMTSMAATNSFRVRPISRSRNRLQNFTVDQLSFESQLNAVRLGRKSLSWRNKNKLDIRLHY